MKLRLFIILLCSVALSIEAANSITPPVVNPANTNWNMNGKTISNFGGTTSASDASAAVTFTLGSVNGTKIGATGDKLSFFGGTPIVKPSGSVITALQNLSLLSSGTINFTELTGSIAIGQIPDALITSAKLRNSAALSVIGRSVNSTGVPADISATAASDAVLRESGSVIGFGTIATGGLADDAVTNAKLRNSGALSLVGRSVNSSGDPADISATAASDAVLRESGSVIGFGTIATGGLADDAVTNAKLRNSGALSLLGRSANSTGDPADISATAASDAVLRESGSVIGFGTIATGGIANDAVTYAKMQNVSANNRILGALTSGDPTELTPANVLTMMESGGTNVIISTEIDTVTEINALTTDLDVATLTGTETLSGKTLTAPKFSDLGYIADSNGNEMLIFDQVSSAVNEITLANAATGNSPTFTSTGGDTNVGMVFTTKGTGNYRVNADAFEFRPGTGSGNGLIFQTSGGTARAQLYWINATGTYFDFDTALNFRAGYNGSNVAVLKSTGWESSTFDANATGNVLKRYEYLQLIAPDNSDGVNATRVTAEGATFGHFTFSNSVDKASNYVLYRFRVPDDIDTAVDLVASFEFRLGGADTAKHGYEISMANCGTSSSCDNPTFSNAVAMNFAGDASGASGDMERIAYTTLTSWRSSLTAGDVIVVKMARDGDDGTNDTSTVNSTDLNLTIRYGSTQ